MRDQPIETFMNDPFIAKMARGEDVFWISPFCGESDSPRAVFEADVREASALLLRFAPVIRFYFPETETADGIIESPLTEIPSMKRALGACFPGRLFLKRDSDLPIAGSVKARGGIYEVLKYTETLALREGIIKDRNDDYLKLIGDKARRFFSGYKIQVGSTGNLGLSIGVMSAALGFRAIVHMSADAKQWKKDLLRSRGATVIEYDGDYGEAVNRGRTDSMQDTNSHFVDDENSKDLFSGYAVAGERLASQLSAAGIKADETHPLFVYLPCGVGGAPCGITYGLNLVFGKNVHCFFAEPTEAPCMLLGAVTGLYEKICVQDIGLSGKTAADGLAVGRCSSFAGKTVKGLVAGEATVPDDSLLPYLKALNQTESIFAEASACAAFHPYRKLFTSSEGISYLAGRFSSDVLAASTHIIWATGGSFVPETLRRQLLK